MVDIVPDMYRKIQKSFRSELDNSSKIRSFSEKVSKKTAASADVAIYSAEVGRCAAAALKQHMAPEDLPGGKLYWNIAERTLKELLKEVHSMVMKAAADVQKIEDAKIGINMKPIAADFPEERVNGLLNKLISILEEDNDE